VPTIQIGNIHPNVLEEDLQAIVSQFGTVVAVTLQRDATGSSKGSAEVLYSDSEGAQLCIEVSLHLIDSCCSCCHWYRWQLAAIVCLRIAFVYNKCYCCHS
jgi:RNA recognition motif. (a.k.a. RRM, RBD, or RNP domain)